MTVKKNTIYFYVSGLKISKITIPNFKILKIFVQIHKLAQN
nr:MAG TPA: hypothetical protein [Caudoviricetes sp.]